MDEGHTVRWSEARAGRASLPRTAAELTPALRAAQRIVLGDPFSRLVQALLPLSRAREITVVDDGTATMEFTELLTRGDRLVRWHRSGRRSSLGRPRLRRLRLRRPAQADAGARP